jgi:hypothetical protein
MNLEVRSDITCNFCLEPVTDFRDAHVFWQRRSRGHPMIAVAHSACDTADVKQYYSLWTHLFQVTERQEEIRRYFNVEIHHNQFTRQEVKHGLEQLFQSVPDEYFRFTEDDYVAFNEGTSPDNSETASREAGHWHCPKCGVMGRNNGPPESDPDEGTLKVPFECLNCGHEWTE